MDLVNHRWLELFHRVLFGQTCLHIVKIDVLDLGCKSFPKSPISTNEKKKPSTKINKKRKTGKKITSKGKIIGFSCESLIFFFFFIKHHIQLGNSISTDQHTKLKWNIHLLIWSLTITNREWNAIKMWANNVH